MEFIVYIIACAVFIMVVRLFGSWMLRINDVISALGTVHEGQKLMLQKLEEISQKLGDSDPFGEGKEQDPS